MLNKSFRRSKVLRNSNFNLKKELKLLPGYLILILWLVFTVVLVGWILLASLSTTREIFSGSLLKSGLHFENYKRALIGGNVGIYLINSAIFTFFGCTLALIVGLPAAYVLARYKFKANSFVQKMFVTGMGVPLIMVALPLYSIAISLNILNSRILLVFLYVATSIPFTTYFMNNFFRTIPGAFEEAAILDGCTQVKAFWVVMVPMAQPGIMTVTIFNFITIWNEYFMALVFVNKTEYKSVGVGLNSMVQSMMYSGDWAGLFASVMLVFLPTFLVYLFLSNKIIASVTSGGVKG